MKVSSNREHQISFTKLCQGVQSTEDDSADLDFLFRRGLMGISALGSNSVFSSSFVSAVIRSSAHIEETQALFVWPIQSKCELKMKLACTC